MLHRSLLLLAALLVVVAGSADATPVQYDYVTGVANVRLHQGMTLLASDNATITGTYATFDDAVPALTDFEIVVDDNAVVLGPLGSIDVLLTAVDGAGWSGPATPTGPQTWNWTGGPASVTGSLAFTGGLLNGQTIPVAISIPTLNGNFRTASTATDTFSLTNAFTVYSFNVEGVDYHVQVSVAFKGVVPEASTAALLALGLCGLAQRRRA